jgi:hypothetical protein
MTVRFLDTVPPKRRTVNINLKRVTKQLTQRPGQWAEIRVYTGKQKQAGYVYAHNCKTAKNRSLSPENGFEVRAQSDGGGAVVVLARYVGRHGEYAAPDDDYLLDLAEDRREHMDRDERSSA